MASGLDREPGLMSRQVFEYAVLRVMPRVERGELLNAGVVLYCRQLDYLAVRAELDEARLAALDPGSDPEPIRRSLAATAEACAAAAAEGRDARGQFFRWLTAPRSTVIQPGPVHTGLTDDPVAEHQRLLRLLVRPLRDSSGMEKDVPRFEPVDESWSGGLAIVAHPDDLEYGTAAAIARWTAQGKRIAYCLATSGEAGIDAMSPEQAGPLREREERDGAAEVGVEVVEFLGHPDGVLEYGLPLRRDIARAVRRHRPDVVITNNFADRWDNGGLNQADHIALGRAVVDGVRDAGNRWVFRDLLDEGLEPWSVTMVLVAGSPQAQHGVDTSDHLSAGIASLRAHAAYLEGLGEHAMADPEEFLEALARQAGTRLGVTFAVAFEVISL
jgi:LmbE family N-acetylglucosaminyl deacetylase